MGRMGIYVKEKIEKEIRDIYLLDVQNGASPAEVSLHRRVMSYSDYA